MRAGSPSAAGGRTRRPVRLPVVQRRKPVRRRTRIGRWRAVALIGLHVLIVAHVLHWWITGRSVGRFVLSDSMRTLELGEINPGVILFALALLVTALLGRFMCGWFCHVGALQDLSAWMLRKVRIRPHLFRSRLLGYVPVALAAYMFLWPTIKRTVVVPALEPLWPDVGAVLGVVPFPGWSVNLTTSRMWDGLPSLVVAIPFLVVCGFATVYFLGARGLCRYACPYGGFLLPAEQMAVGRIVVDSKTCDQCGVCTANCTAGVRVHDEVREHGSIVDRNCIRTFDCVRGCPKDALSFTIATPAAFAGKRTWRRAYDLTWGEELLCVGVFTGSFLVLRGLYDAVPLLMAAPLAVIAAYLTWKLVRLRRDANVRLGGMQLKLRGRVSRCGRGFAVAMVGVAALLGHSTAVRGLLWAGARHDNAVQVSYEDALAGTVSPEARAHAAAGLRLYRMASSLGEGGIGLLRTPGASMRSAWLQLVVGDFDRAERSLRAILASPRRTDELGIETARLMVTRGRPGDAIDILERTVERSPGFAQSRDMLAALLVQQGSPDRAEAVYRAALDRRPADPIARAGLGRLMLTTGRLDAALEHLNAAADLSDEPAVQRDRAIALFSAGRVNDAVRTLEIAADRRPAAKSDLLMLASAMLTETGRHAEAQSMRVRAQPGPR